MRQKEMSRDASHTPRRQNPNHRDFRCLLLINLLLSINGFSTPTATYTPPSHFLIQRRSLPPQRAVPFDYRNSHQQWSIQESLTTNGMDGYNRKNANTISKIKSPSNQYSEFNNDGVLVGIERTSFNSRRISGEIMMDIPIDDVWEILTDYDNLSSHVPNLMESKVINNDSTIVGGTPRVYQRGAQRIFGFQFGADLTLDMMEYVHHGQYSIDFECVDSQFFSQFDGSWILEEYTDGMTSTPKTMVRYIVDVTPKGPVPVAALEWRIKEDVPLNILAVSKSASARARTQEQRRDTQSRQKLEPVPPQQLQSNPLQQLTEQAAFTLDETAKYVLPTHMISTAKQAIKVMEFSMALSGGGNEMNGGNTKSNARSAERRRSSRLSSSFWVQP